MTIPSSKDPTLAPDGHHVVLLFTMYTPYHLSNGRVWDDTTRNQYADCGENILYTVNMPILSVRSEKLTLVSEKHSQILTNFPELRLLYGVVLPFGTHGI